VKIVSSKISDLQTKILSTNAYLGEDKIPLNSDKGDSVINFGLI